MARRLAWHADHGSESAGRHEVPCTSVPYIYRPLAERGGGGLSRVPSTTTEYHRLPPPFARPPVCSFVRSFVRLDLAIARRGGRGAGPRGRVCVSLPQSAAAPLCPAPSRRGAGAVSHAVVRLFVGLRSVFCPPPSRVRDGGCPRRRRRRRRIVVTLVCSLGRRIARPG
jgi:hypothetical protein